VRFSEIRIESFGIPKRIKEPIRASPMTPVPTTPTFENDM
jgi:hypothetical protein